MIISLEAIKHIIRTASQINDARFNQKKHCIDLYEQTENIKVCDSAYPIEWRDPCARYFNIKDIGDWCWAYGPGASHGIPLPCNERALVLLELMIYKNTDGGLIYMYNYMDNRIYYTTMEMGWEEEWAPLMSKGVYFDNLDKAIEYVRERKPDQQVGLATYDQMKLKNAQWSNL